VSELAADPAPAADVVLRRIDRFLCRGLAACRSEWRFVMATPNLLKLWRSGLAPAAA
jgi:hypothetical protein